MAEFRDRRAVVDRDPPQATDAERAVLSSCLRTQALLGEALEYLVAEDFFSPRHQAIFAALQTMSERGEPPDLVTVAVQLEKDGQLEAIGGPAVLEELLDVPSSPANLAYHARIVAERARLRSIIKVSNQTATRAYDHTEDSDELLDHAQNEFFQLAQKSERRSYEPLQNLATVTFERIQEAYNRGDELTGVSTGFTDLNKLTGGLQPSDLVIIAGRPSMGKTSFALNLAFNAARADRPAPVGIFSLEMSSEQLVMRLIAAQGRLDGHSLRTGRLSHQDWPRLTQTLSELTKTPMYIDDTSGISLLELRSKARRMVQLHGVKLIIIDYMQLVTVGGRIENRQQEISLISRSLKGMAKDLDVPVVALSQLSRAVESRGGEHRPMLSDLRESGAIEQDADVVMFVYRQSVYEPENPEVSNLAEIIIGKQRNGPIDTVKLHFDNRYTLFSNLAREGAARG